MQHHMFSLNTIKCTVRVCENIKIRYIIGLLFIVTEAKTSLLLETSVVLAVRIFPATTLTCEGHGTVGEWQGPGMT
jgi:hypothetical protein